jgi:hypothetical protein
MVEEDGYVHDGWLKRMVLFMADSCRGLFCSWQKARKDDFVYGKQLERMVTSLVDGCRGWICDLFVSMADSWRCQLCPC